MRSLFMSTNGNANPEIQTTQDFVITDDEMMLPRQQHQAMQELAIDSDLSISHIFFLEFNGEEQTYFS